MDYDGMCMKTLLVNGLIRTMDRTYPVAQAMTMGNNSILAIGGNDDIEALADSETVLIDLGGRLALPGCWNHIWMVVQACRRTIPINWKR